MLKNQQSNSLSYFTDIISNSMFIRINKACNQNCLFCLNSNNLNKKMSETKILSEINFAIDNFITHVSFTGGEPTLVRDLINYVDYAKKLGIKYISIQTNGVYFSKISNIQKFMNAGMNSLLISLHSHEDNISNLLTGSNDFKKTIMALDNLSKTSVFVAISHVINAKNVDNLIDFVKFIVSINKNFFLHFSFIRPTGNAKKNSYLVPRLKNIDDKIRKLISYCHENNIGFDLEGLPLCYMEGFFQYNFDYIRLNKNNSLKKLISFSRVKDKICNSCKLNFFCTGIWKEYAEIYGTSELRPYL